MRWMSKAWTRIGQAVFDFKAYVTEMPVEGKHHIEQNKPTTGNLVVSLIRVSEQVSYEDGTKGYGLLESEIYGNIFVLHFAGYDTIAIPRLLSRLPRAGLAIRRDPTTPPQP